jgi:two-component system chemotaxis response regulator CheB
MRYLEVDHVVPADSLGKLLGRLARERVDAEHAPPPSAEMLHETRIVGLDPEALDTEEKPGVQSVVSCPDCRGVLWEIQENNLLRFRCRTGHAFSPETLLAAENEGVEKALWEALRSIEERVSLRRRLVEQAKERRLDSLASHFEAKVQESESAVRSLRSLLLEGSRN